MSEASYVRFQGTVRSPRGHFPGCSPWSTPWREGRLTPGRSASGARTTTGTTPTTPIPRTPTPRLRRTGEPGAVAWFKSSSRELIGRVDGYLEILAAHGVECRMLRSTDPGRVVYEDAYQVVVVPREGAPRGATERGVGHRAP
ncbi:hypothetical protein NKH77_25965 [Streptomyces sp. M19]